MKKEVILSCLRRSTFSFSRVSRLFFCKGTTAEVASSSRDVGVFFAAGVPVLQVPRAMYELPAKRKNRGK